jgi:hypothetical protein
MKVVAKDIETVVWFSKEGIIPLRFKYENDNGENIVIKVDKVISKQKEKYCGNEAWLFDCQSEIDGVILKLFQLKFFISECKWVLWKI